MVDRVVTSLMEIKAGTKKPTVALYEEVSKFEDTKILDKWLSFPPFDSGTFKSSITISSVVLHE